jgi:plastocyanin
MRHSCTSSRRRAGERQTLILVSALVIVLAVGILAASCGGGTGGGLYGGGGSTTTTVGASTTVSTPGTTTGGGAGGGQVVMKNLAFDPATVTIRAGESVTWTNQDSMNHTVVADQGEFKSGELANGATFSFTFDKAGTYPYHCSIHPSMTGTVVVQ